MQGYTLISQADTKENWEKHRKQWVKHETTFTAPSNAVRAALLSWHGAVPASSPVRTCGVG